MTTHELARRLLEMPDMPVYTRNQTYDETTWEEVGAATPTDMVVTEHGGAFDAACFNPPLKDARQMKAVVIE